MKKALTIALSCILAAGCGSEPPHSNYYIISFLPGTPAPAQEGIEALDIAVKAALGNHPSSVAVDAAEPPQGEGVLARQRANVVVDAFTKAGIASSRVHVQLTPSDEKSYEARKDTLIVQLLYGEESPKKK